MDDRTLGVLWRSTMGVTALAVLAGCLFALGNSRAGAWVAVTALVVGVPANLALSAVKYRRTMRRPWPAVQPLADDDDWG
jgi:hypothetical protein